MLRLRKLSASYDPGDRIAAMNYIHEHQARGEVVTGLLYVDRKARDLHQHLNTVAAPFNALEAAELCPGGEGAGQDQRVVALILRHPSTLVIPAKAGIQPFLAVVKIWIPAFAGMTRWA